MLDLAAPPLRCLLPVILLAAVSAPAAAMDAPGEPSSAEQWIAAAPADASAKSDPGGRHLVRLVSSGGRSDLWSVDLETGAATRLASGTAGEDEVTDFVLSPDGQRLAFAARRDGGPRRLYVVDVTGGLPRRVDDPRDDGADVGRFAFSADSSALAFEATSATTPLQVVSVDTIFNEGFEGGSTANWFDSTPGVCPAPTGGPTMHANAVANGAVWTANGSPHVLTANVDVGANSGSPVTLTIEPCAEVWLNAGVGLTVNATGTLHARGTPAKRITFRRNPATPTSPFAKLWVRSPGVLDLAFADLAGGDGGSVDAVINVEGSAATRPILDHVHVTGSAGTGVRLSSNAMLSASSRAVVITGSGATPGRPPFPLRVEGLAAVDTIPTGVYTGNASDLIQVIATSALQTDTTFHDRGVPYQIGGGGSFGVLNVGGGASLATLTVEPGTQLRFFSPVANIGGLFINSNGQMVAAGTASRPILFTADGNAPAAGAWEGVTFSGTLASGNLLDHVQIEAAGAHGGDQGYGCPPAADGNATDAGLKIFTQPAEAFLFNSTISNSSTHGVFRAWTGAAVDFLPSNSFVNVAFCNQVLPKPPAGNCPLNPECPK